MHTEILHPPNMPPLHQNSVKPTKSNGISFWAFILSIFIYISIFYIFNLSPYHVFNTTKFWFLLSNTIILIIAADFGAFSSSKQDDLYDEYVKNNRARSAPSVELLHYPKIVEKNCQKQQVVDKFPQEEIKNVIVVHKTESPKNKSEIVAKNDLERPVDNFQENNTVEPASMVVDDEKTCDQETEKSVAVANNDRRIVVHSSEIEKQDYSNVEEDEFSSMSNEELNRRAEEFIQNVNRQIRIQAVASRLQEVY